MRFSKKRLLISLVFLVLFAIPFVGSQYLLYIISLASVFSIAAVGLDILMGYAGQICFGQAGFLAVGAYVTAFLVKQGVSYWASLPAGAVMAGVAGANNRPARPPDQGPLPRTGNDGLCVYYRAGAHPLGKRYRRS